MVSASNLNGKQVRLDLIMRLLRSQSSLMCAKISCVLQFMVECEWQRRDSQALTLPVTHVLSFGEIYFSVPNSLEQKNAA